MILGLIGAAGCGKSTVAKHLVAEYGYVETAAAAPLKALCADQFGWDLERLDSLSYKEEQDPNLPDGWTRRRVLQFVGTECFRHIDPDHWVKLSVEQITLLVRDGFNVVISDVRFPNEIEKIRELGGLIVLIERKGEYRGTTAPSHVSEEAWREARWDYKITSQSGIPKLQSAVDGLLTMIERRP